MKTPLKSLLAATLVATLPAAAMAGDTIIDVAPLLRVVGGNTNALRAIVPKLVQSDNAQKLPQLSMAVGVYDPVSATPTTPLFTTTIKTFPLPKATCTGTVTHRDSNQEPKFMGMTLGQRLHMVWSATSECSNSTGSWVEKSKTFVYSADVTAAGGTVWTKSIDQRLLGASGVDLNGDGTNESILLILEVPVTGSNKANAHTVVLNNSDGSVIKDLVYPNLWSCSGTNC